MCVCSSVHQLHHVVIARFYEQIPLATRMQQMSSKDSKKMLYYKMAVQQTIVPPLGEYWRQYGNAMREV